MRPSVFLLILQMECYQLRYFSSKFLYRKYTHECIRNTKIMLVCNLVSMAWLSWVSTLG